MPHAFDPGPVAEPFPTLVADASVTHPTAALPSWMHERDGWAARGGSTDVAERRDITITVPAGIVA